MSHNGPWPGPPSHPWSNGTAGEPYAAPADPWGRDPVGDHQGTADGDWSDPRGSAGAGWGGHSASLAPAYEQPYGPPYDAPAQPYHPAAQAYGASALNAEPPGWGAPPVPPRRNTPIVALIVVLALLAAGGLATTAWLLRGSVPARGTGPPSPAGTTPTAAANVADPQPSEDARFVKKGQCVRNRGTTDVPVMTIVPCTTGTYQVLKRIDGRTTGEPDAEAKCAKVPGYTKWYFYDSELDSLDFVLCLRER